MAAVTQVIPNYIGGVSSQPDERKLPGQVTEATNVYIDPTFGLTKRQGLQFLTTLDTYNNDTDPLNGASWFVITRDDDEAYFGCVVDGGLRIWNAIPEIINGEPTFVECNITGDNVDYLIPKDKDGNTLPESHGNFKFVTVQDVTYIINETKVVEEEPRVEYKLGRKGTIRLKSIDPGVDYTVLITPDGGTEQPCVYKTPIPDITAEPPDDPLSAETVLAGIKQEIDGKNISGLTVVQLGQSLELFNDTASFKLDCKGGTTGIAIDSFQDEVGNVARLPATCLDGRRVKIINTADERSSYFVIFKAADPDKDPTTDDEFAGDGLWEEDLGWSDVDGVNKLASTGLVNSTMPYIIKNVDKNEFVLEEAEYENRLVGSEASNSPPSFVGSVISEGFVYNNRLGFLSAENIILSQSGEFTNFYFTTARTILDSDPIDLNCSSIRPAKLHAVIPQTQGLILFSQFEQFIMYSEDGALTPSSASIRSISNYESEINIDPVDVGTQILFLSKTKSSTRTMAMITRGLNDNPIVVDISKVAAEYVPDTIDILQTSPQNSFVVLASQFTKEAYVYRFYNNGERDVMQSWFKWTLPGTVQTLSIVDDQVFMITKNAGQYNLSLIYQQEDVQNHSSGLAGTPRMDFYCPVIRSGPGSISYDSSTNKSTIPHLFNNDADLKPVVMTTPPLIPQTVRKVRGLGDLYALPDDAKLLSAGQLLEVTRDGDLWLVDGDWTGKEAELLIGWQVDMEVELPRIYFRLQEQSDFTANLTLSRMKFSCGTTGQVTFQCKKRGSDDWIDVYPVIDADYYLADNSPFINDIIFTVPVHQKNTNIVFKIIADTPFPFSLNSLMWEGQYSPRFYRRT